MKRRDKRELEDLINQYPGSEEFQGVLLALEKGKRQAARLSEQFSKREATKGLKDPLVKAAKAAFDKMASKLAKMGVEVTLKKISPQEGASRMVPGVVGIQHPVGGGKHWVSGRMVGSVTVFWTNLMEGVHELGHVFDLVQFMSKHPVGLLPERSTLKFEEGADKQVLSWLKVGAAQKLYLQMRRPAIQATRAEKALGMDRPSRIGWSTGEVAPTEEMVQDWKASSQEGEA